MHPSISRSAGGGAFPTPTMNNADDERKPAAITNILELYIRRLNRANASLVTWMNGGRHEPPPPGSIPGPDTLPWVFGGRHEEDWYIPHPLPPSSSATEGADESSASSNGRESSSTSDLFAESSDSSDTNMDAPESGNSSDKMDDEGREEEVDVEEEGEGEDMDEEEEDERDEEEGGY